MPAAPPPNVQFINVGQHGLGILFGSALARLGGALEHTYAITKLMQQLFYEYRYIVTEYKHTSSLNAAPWAPRQSCQLVL